MTQAQLNQINLTQNDTGPNIILNLTDQLSGNIINLTGFTSGFMIFRQQGMLGQQLSEPAVTVNGLPTLGQLLLTLGSGPTGMLTSIPASIVLPAYFEGQLKLTISGELISSFAQILFYVQPSF